ncbi:MAG: hypothetical protein IJT30_01920 [Muribaculaceae bacterium]|nr:hypothetical protein [Muribaculaceae bacterium]
MTIINKAKLISRGLRCTVCLLAVVAWHPLAAQQRVLAEVKKSLDGLTMTVANYQNAINRLQPALSHDETRNNPETWYVAGKAQFGLHDKYKATRQLGKKVDAKAMGTSLLQGYDHFMHALTLDTIFETDSKGRPRLDKKTGKPKYRTRFSTDINDRVAKHIADFNVAGGELYNSKEWDGAYRAWQVYLDLSARYPEATIPDTVAGLTRYYQGIALWQKGDNRQAANHFALARHLGYKKKEAYDYALVCLSSEKDEQAIVDLAREAYEQLGVSDPQYVRILINNHINRHELNQAEALIDAAIAIDSNDSELQNLKGLVAEQLHGMEQALPYFQRSVELDGDNAQALFNLGRYYYNQAAQITDNNSKLSVKALAKKVNPIYRQALPYLERAYELDPANEDARAALRNIYYKLGDARKLDALDRRR